MEEVQNISTKEDVKKARPRPHRFRTTAIVLAVVGIMVLLAVLGLRVAQRSYIEEVTVALDASSPAGGGGEEGVGDAPVPAPDFTLKDLSAAPVTLRDFRGAPLVLLFFAQWHEQSLAALRLINDFHRGLTEQGVVVRAVDSLESVEAVRTFASRMALTAPILVDEEGVVTEAYRVGPLPAFFFIDADGMIREQVVGALTKDDLLVKAMQLKEH